MAFGQKIYELKKIWNNSARSNKILNAGRSSWIINILTFIGLWVPPAFYGYAQEFEINNFGPNSYRAASDNYQGIESKNGTWYFANENGVLEYDGSRWELITIKDYSSVHALLETESGKMYVGGNNEFGYIEKDSLDSFAYTSLRHLVNMDDPISEVWNIISLGKDIYFECREKIIRYDGKKAFEIDITEGYIFKIDHFLYASIHNRGLVKIENDTYSMIDPAFNFPNDGAFRAYPMINSTGTLPPGHLLTTAFHGIYRFDHETGIVEPWPTEIDELLRKEGLADMITWRDSLYAVTTLSAGLVFLDKYGRVQKALGEDAGIADTGDQIKTLFDELDPKIEGLINEENGLPTNQLRALFQDQRGNIWISSLYGISYLKWPGTFNEDYEAKTVLQDVMLTSPDASDKRSVEFRFATPGYDRSDLEYSFYLEGFEETWLPWTDAVEKEYTNLDGGLYDFHVKARTYDGFETAEVTYSFFIPTPWYKNSWTYLFGFSVLSTLVFLGVRYRTTRLKKMNRRLERIIENRTRELMMQKEQLKVANEELMIINTELDNFVYRSSHDLVAPLKSLKGLVNLARHEKPSEIQTTYLKMMESSIGKLEDFIKSIMEYSMNVKKEIEKETINLDNVLEDILSELKFFDKADRVKVVKKFDKQVCLATDPERLKIVLSNLVTNSIKYHNYEQNLPLIEIDAFGERDHFKITVADNGMGIEDQYLDKIFDMFFRASSTSDGSGLGLYIVKDTLAKIKGDIAVHSTYGEGTTFTISLPQN